MENQQPGQVFSPQPKNNDGSHSVGNSQKPNNNPAQPQTPNEIEQIDTAMQSQPQNDNSDQEPEPAPISQEPAPQQPVQSPQQSPEINYQQDQAEAVAAANQSAATEDNFTQEVSTDGGSEQLLGWQAAEPAESFGSSRLLMTVSIAGLFVTVGVFAFGGFNFSTIFGAIVVLLGIVALVLSNRQPGHMEEYAIYPEGIVIGRNFYPFSELRAFSIVSSGSAENIELIPAKRFMPTLSVYLEPTTAETAVETLAQRLPHEEREPDLVDRISHKFRM